MAKFPVFYSGQRLTAAALTSMEFDITTKTGATTRTNNTITNDPDLSGIALGVGLYYVRMILFVTCTASATPDVKTQWTFTGTWNTPLRYVIGPQTSTSPNAITTMRMSAQVVNSDSVYDIGSSSTYTGIEEWCTYLNVTVAGNLALAWAQNVTNANGVTLNPYSSVEVRQIG
jgi:hypothetical protein